MTRPARKSVKSMQRECDRFNERHPVGTVVLCWTGLRNDGPPVERTIKEPGATIAPAGYPVVYMTSGGCIALSHIKGAA